MENQLAIIDQVPAITKSLPEALQLNNDSLTKAKTYGENLYLEITEKGMNDDYDKKLNDYLVKLKSTLKTCNERRSPLTQFFDTIKKQFTLIESEIDQKSELYTKGQKLRDFWAEKKRKEEERKQADVLLQSNIAKEKIDVKAKIEIGLRQWFLNNLEQDQLMCLEAFEGLTLTTIDNFIIDINVFVNEYPRKHFDSYNELPLTRFIKTAECSEIFNSIKTDQIFNEFCLEYKSSIEQTKASLIEKLPSKKKELESIANADGPQKKILQSQIYNRKKIEDAKIITENQNKLNEQAATIETAKQVETANTLFDISQQAGEPEKVAQGIESYDLSILNIAVLPMIYQFWWEREGKYMNLKDLEKKTIKQMIAFAEKWAKSKDEKIKSEFLEYKPVYKTVAKSK